MASDHLLRFLFQEKNVRGELVQLSVNLNEELMKEHSAEGQFEIRYEYCNQTYMFEHQA